jgi:hypothetical protein
VREARARPRIPPYCLPKRSPTDRNPGRPPAPPAKTIGFLGHASCTRRRLDVSVRIATSANEASMFIKIIPNTNGSPVGKLADAELHCEVCRPKRRATRAQGSRAGISIEQPDAVGEAVLGGAPGGRVADRPLPATVAQPSGSKPVNRRAPQSRGERQRSPAPGAGLCTGR